jgi:DNA-binding Lrp family transcriptional regulator
MFLDVVDNKIISLLQQDASLGYEDVARKLGMNESTIRKRILLLRERHVITKFSVEVDSALLGFRARSILGVDVEPSKLLHVSGQLSRTPGSPLSVDHAWRARPYG